MRAFIASVLLLLLTAGQSAGQHARGYSEPGPLGATLHGPDQTPPRIVITKPGDTGDRANRARGLKIVPEASGEVVLMGRIEDDRGVAGLTINGHDILLWGWKTQRKFGLKLKAPAAGKVLKLHFLAKDEAGNQTEEDFEISVPAFETETDRRAGLRLTRKVPLSPDRARYWALIVAVGDYSHPSVPDLDYPVPDARDLALVLVRNYTFDRRRVRFLRNPTRAELIGALADFAPSGGHPLTPQDNLLVYYAGHGHYDADYDEGYWLPSDAEKQSRANWVSNSDVQRAFRGIRAQHILLLSDACFSGSLFATRQAFTVAIEEAYKERSRKAITAGNLTQVPDRSVFKEYLVKRLQDNTSAYLDAGTLYSSIKAPVTNNSPLRQRPLYGIIQQTGDEGGEFIFVHKQPRLSN